MSNAESIAWLKARLGDRIAPVPVQGDQPLLLDDPSCAYLLLSEHHQLFCVGYQAGAPVGRREHLAVCEPGQLIFGLQPPSGENATALLLSGVAGSIVWRVPMASLLALSNDRDGRRVLAQLFDRWIALLIAALPNAPVPTRSQSVAAGQQITAEADVSLASPAGITWIAPRAAPQTYRGMTVADYAVHADCWPLSESAWALCGATESMRVWSTEQLLEASADAAFAAGFYAFVVAVVSAQRGALAEARLQRDARSHEAEHEFVASALEQLAAVGTDQRLSLLEPVRDDAFERACRQIFSWLKLDPMPRVATPKSATLSDMHAALSATTGVRTRAVLIENDFLKDDSGPLLGFLVEGDERLQPVALLPSGRHYTLYDPRNDKPVRLTAELLERLHPQAHQFYRTFPAEPLGPLDVLRFSAMRTRSDLLVIVLIGLLVGGLGTLVPLLTGQIFDRIIPGAERGLLVQLMLVLVSVYAGSWLFDVARAFALVRAQTRMDATLEAGVWDRLLRLPLPFFRRYSAGDLAARAAGIGSIRELLAQVGLSTILSGIFSIWNFALLFYFDLRLALGASCLVLLAGAVAAFASYYELGLQRSLADLDGKIGGLLLQLLNGIAKLRVSDSENRAFGVWARLFARRRKLHLQGERIHNRVLVFHTAYPVLCSALLYWLVASAEKQNLTTGQFLAFSTAFAIFLRAVLDVISAGLQTLSLIPLYERARPILEHPIESPGTGNARVDIKGSIELSHVSFRYEEDGPLILDDINVSIEPGEFVAIVGPSGSGKSTLLRLLLGFEPPSEGGVFYDAQALVGMDVRAVRRQIGVVLQHSQVMAGDLYTNIVGNSGLSIDDAWRAARQAAFDKDIEAMPMGMHTVLGQGGGTLSGGQRQRLLIARALAAQPRVLFFDEATSALDNRTQTQVSDSLSGLRVTRVVIAHRLSTVKHADTILVLERGRIVQRGRFSELLAAGGAFGDLARRQML